MKWFRATAATLIVVTFTMATIIAGLIIDMCTEPGKQKHMDYDPNYNGTLGVYIVIVVIQFMLIPTLLYGLFIAFKNWKNNYQLDHIARRRYITWMSVMVLLCLINVSVAVFAIVRGKEPQKEMANLYDVFAQTNKDTTFVKAFEKYQKDKACCGIYGPDDWLMVQLRSSFGGGGGGGGFQSLDYGFQQNPSTGNCHLTPPIIPMGCGKKIIESVHYTLSTFAGILIFETIVGFATVSFAGYCFYYWLDKEVIVIPEDEISNMIIMEGRSSTSDNVASTNGMPPQMYPPGGGMGGSRHSNAPHYGNYPEADYGSRSRGGSYMGSYRGSRDYQGSNYGRGSGSNYHGGSTSRRPTGHLPSLGPFNSNPIMPEIQESGTGGGGPPKVDPAGSTNAGEGGGGGVGSSNPNATVPGGTANLAFDWRKRRYSLSNAYDPRFTAGGPMNPSGSIGQQSPFYHPYYPGSLQLSYHDDRPPPPQLSYLGAATYPPRGNSIPGHSRAGPSHVSHSTQEKVHGGKVLAEIHVDHTKSDDEVNEDKAQKPRHPTIAIVRNKKPPKPKMLFAQNA